MLDELQNSNLQVTPHPFTVSPEFHGFLYGACLVLLFGFFMVLWMNYVIDSCLTPCNRG